MEINSIKFSSSPHDLIISPYLQNNDFVLPNISSCVGYDIDIIITSTIVKLREKDSMSIASDSEEINNIELICKNKRDSVKFIDALVELGDLLIQYSLYDEAYYFYFIAIEKCTTFGIPESNIKHDASLQIAKILFAGNIQHSDSSIHMKELAGQIFDYLIMVFKSEEAMVYRSND